MDYNSKFKDTYEPSCARLLKMMIWTFLFIVTVIVIVHVSHAESVKNNPPVACQVLGGSWNAWNGWTCQ